MLIQSLCPLTELLKLHKATLIDLDVDVRINEVGEQNIIPVLGRYPPGLILVDELPRSTVTGTELQRFIGDETPPIVGCHS